MTFLLISLAYAGCVFFLIAVHEVGHYLAGRIGGVSAHDMRIRLFRFPQHVELRDTDRWVAPTTEIDSYVKLVWQYLQTKPRVYLYIAGGIMMETIAVIVVCVPLLLYGQPKLALAVVYMSWCLLLPWLIIDAIAVARGRVLGDFSGLWLLAALPTAAIIAGMIAVRLGLMWWAGALPL